MHRRDPCIHPCGIPSAHVSPRHSLRAARVRISRPTCTLSTRDLSTHTVRSYTTHRSAREGRSSSSTADPGHRTTTSSLTSSLWPGRAGSSSSMSGARGDRKNWRTRPDIPSRRWRTTSNPSGLHSGSAQSISSAIRAAGSSQRRTLSGTRRTSATSYCAARSTAHKR